MQNCVFLLTLIFISVTVTHDFYSALICMPFSLLICFILVSIGAYARCHYILSFLANLAVLISFLS